MVQQGQFTDRWPACILYILYILYIFYLTLRYTSENFFNLSEVNMTLFNLKRTEMIYRDRTVLSYYFFPDEPFERKHKPIDINGYRYKLSLETGEFRPYDKRECEQSLNQSVNRSLRKINQLLEMNDFEFFFTFTFDESHNRSNDDYVYYLIGKYFKNVRKQHSDISYFGVPERHEDNCLHFHVLMNGDDLLSELKMVDSGKVCCHWATFKNGICSKEYFERTKEGRELNLTDGLPVYNVTSYKYGFSTATLIASREACNFYVKKYVEKALGSTDLFKRRFFYSKNLNLPQINSTILSRGNLSTKPFKYCSEIINDPLYSNSKLLFNCSNYNVMHCEISNSVRYNIARGLIPLSDDHIVELLDSLEKPQQLSYDDIF